MKYILTSRIGLVSLLILPLRLSAQEVSATASPSGSDQPRGLRDFAQPVPLATPDASITPAAPYHLRESWSRLVGKGFAEVILEAERAFQAGDYARAADIDSYALLMQISRQQAAIATMNRGNAYAGLGDLENALRDLNESVTLDPRNASGYLNRALVLRRQNDNAGAQKDYAESLRLDPKQWQTYFNRAHDEAEDGDVGAAMVDLDHAAALRPEDPAILVAHAGLHLRLRAWDKVIADCTSAIKLDSGQPESHLYLARASAAKGDYAKAEKEVETLLKAARGPRFLALNAVAWMRATSPDEKLRRGADAVKLAKEACEATEWKRWQTVDTLAAAYAEAGDFEKAIQYEQQVLGLKLTSNEEQKARERLALYQQRKPYREETGL